MATVVILLFVSVTKSGIQRWLPWGARSRKAA